MAGLILVGLLVLGGIILVVMLITKQGKKRVRIFSGGYFIVIASFMFYTNHTCGPNSTDVKIMTPQAEAISNYILENGIPESLAKIPNLPYPLEDCTKATDGTNVENCSFNVGEDMYRNELDSSGGNYSTYIYIDIYNKKSETGISSQIKQSNGVSEMKYHKPYSTKNDGICNPLRM